MNNINTKNTKNDKVNDTVNFPEHNYMKLIKSLPVKKHHGRQKILPKLFYDFEKDTFYYYTGKEKNKNGKLTSKYYTNKNPYKMEEFIKHNSELEGTKLKETNAYYTKETVSEYLTEFITNQRYDIPATIRYYNICQKRVSKIIGNILLINLTPDDCEQLINEELKKYSVTTVIKDYEFLQMAFSKAQKMRKIIFNPMEMVNKPKKNKDVVIDFYTPEETKKIISYCMNTYKQDISDISVDKNNIVCWSVLIAILTGLRKEEVMGLKFSDIHIHNEEIPYLSVNRARTDLCDSKKLETKALKTVSSQRDVPLPNELIELFLYIESEYNKNKKENKNFIDSQFIISYSNGTIPATPTISTRQRNFILKAGVDRILGFKELRHTFATLVRDGGCANPFDLQIAMGHSSVTTSEKYYLGKRKVLRTNALKSFENMTK